MKKVVAFENSDVNIANISGQVFLGTFNDLIASLNSNNHKDLAQALCDGRKAIMETSSLETEQKEEISEVLEQIAQETNKAKPNKTILRSIAEGLRDAVKAIPDAAKAIEPIMTIMGKIYL